jgi:hypothetical protein
MIQEPKHIKKFVLVLFILYILGVCTSNHLTTKYYSRYEKVEFGMGFNEVIIKQRAERSNALLETKSGRKLLIYHNAYNYRYKPSSLNQFLRPGDSIVKKAYYNHLYVHRGDSTYYFLIGREIGRRTQ